MNKTILHIYQRQYRHNNSDELIAGYDYEGINQLFEKLIEAVMDSPYTVNKNNKGHWHVTGPIASNEPLNFNGSGVIQWHFNSQDEADFAAHIANITYRTGQESAKS